jgi:hypothetical protein
VLETRVRNKNRHTKYTNVSFLCAGNIETTAPTAILERKEELLKAIEAVKQESNLMYVLHADFAIW